MRLLTCAALLHVAVACSVEAQLLANIPAAGNAWHIALGDVTGDGVDEVLHATYDGRICAQRATSSCRRGARVRGR